MTEASLKPGWRKWRFEQIATNVNERIDNPSESDLEYYVGLEHIDSDSLKLRRWGSPSDVESTKLIFHKGDIIFGKRRVYQRKVAVAEFDGICSAHALVLRAKPEVILPEFLPFFMQSDLFMERAKAISVGSLSPTINWKTLAKEEFVLPSIDDQKIVAKRLALVDQALYACEDCIEHSRSIIRSFLLRELPPIHENASHWPIVRLGEIIRVIDPNPSHRYPDYLDDGVPLVATQDFKEEDDYCFDRCRRVSSKVFFEQKERCKFTSEDVIFARKGILGFARMYGESEKAFSHTVVVLKPKKKNILARYVLWLCRSDSLMAEINKKMNSNSGVPTLGVKTIENLRVWLPPEEEQLRIVRYLDSVNKAKESFKARIWKSRILKARILMFEEKTV